MSSNQNKELMKLYILNGQSWFRYLDILYYISTPQLVGMITNHEIIMKDNQIRFTNKFIGDEI